MGGFASLIGGAGQEATRYGQQVRALNFQRWAELQRMVSDQYDQAIKSLGPNATPEAVAELYKGKTAALKLKPGEDPSKIIENVQSHLTLHPNTQKLFAPQQPQTTPGPAPVGQPPGTPVAAQPSGSPVQPQEQDNGSPNALRNLIASPIGGPTPPAPQAQAAPQPQQAQAPAQSAVAPMPQGGEDPGQALMARYLQSEGFNPPSLPTAVAPFLSNQAELERQKQLIGLRTGVLNQSGVMNNPNINPTIRALLPLEAAGVNVPMYGLTRTLAETTQTVDSDQLPPHERAAYGIPTDAHGPWEVDLDFGHQPVGQARPARPSYATGTTTDLGLAQYNRNNPNAPPQVIPGLHPTGAVEPKVEPMAGGQAGAVTPLQMLGGQGPKPIPGAVSAATAPTIHHDLRTIQTVDADGNRVTRLEPIVTVTSKGSTNHEGVFNPGTPSQGAKEFPAALTPEQHLRADQSLGQYTLAIDRMQSIRNRLPLLNSIIDAGKINLEMNTDGFLKAIINRTMPTTEAENQLIADFRTMTEDINLLRGPMGATGFRGPEGWAALQAQRGQLLAKPEITGRVLDNSIKALQAQQKPLQQVLQGKGGPPANAQPTVKKYNPATGKLE